MQCATRSDQKRRSLSESSALRLELEVAVCLVLRVVLGAAFTRFHFPWPGEN